MNHGMKKSKMRSLLVGMTMILMLSAVIFRLFWIQTVSASFLREQAQKTWEKKEVIQPNRGSILDRRGGQLCGKRGSICDCGGSQPGEKPPENSP